MRTRKQMGQNGQQVSAHRTDEFYRRYVLHAQGPSKWRRGILHYRKRHLWSAVVHGAHAAQPAIDVVGSLTLLIVGMPLFLLVALLTKLTDFGSALCWQAPVRLSFQLKQE